MRSIRLLTDAWPDEPGLDTGISHALVAAVGAGSEPETLRLHQAAPVLAFGRRDTVSAGYADAVTAAIDHGYLPIERLAGGRAAVFHEGTIAFSWAQPTADPRSGVEERFRQIAMILQEGLEALGVEATIGEVPGEYCPGRYSISARGRSKIVGIGQRLVRGAAHVGGVIVVDGHDRISDVLVPVYRALGIDWDPDTAGSIAAEVGTVTVPEVLDTLSEVFARHHRLTRGRMPARIVDHGRSLAPGHLARGTVVGRRLPHP